MGSHLMFSIFIFLHSSWFVAINLGENHYDVNDVYMSGKSVKAVWPEFQTLPKINQKLERDLLIKWSSLTWFTTPAVK